MCSFSPRRIFVFALLGSLFALATRWVDAAPVTLTFEGLHHFESVHNYYDGINGANNIDYGGPLAGPGPNYGIIFSDSGEALQETGPLANFMNEPTFQTIMSGQHDNLITMTVADGFVGTLGLWYTGDATTQPVPQPVGMRFDTIKIYDINHAPIQPVLVQDSNGYTLGPPLAGEPPLSIAGPSVVLPGIPIATAFDPAAGHNVDNTIWDHVTIFMPPQATAYFVDFTGAGNHFGIDNIELNIVPEPASAILLILCGVAALATRRSRFRHD